MSIATAGTTRGLASFLSDLRFEDLPREVVDRTEEFFLDWIASALAGRNARPVRILEHFASMMGPDEGPREILVSRRRTSPFFAALVNGAAVAHLLGADEGTMLHALGSAETQAAGLWEFLLNAADSKQLHTSKAAADGLLSAYIARGGFTGATRILEGKQGMAAAMSSDPDPTKLTKELGERWAVLETSFKFHASCRHTHPAADALLQAMQELDLTADYIARVRAHVYQAAIDVLGPVTDPQTVHQSKFSMGFVLALIALHGRAGVTEFTDQALRDPQIRGFADRVEMAFDPEIDAAYPERWISLVEVETTDGERFASRVDVPKGDPGNTLSRAELEDKARCLGAFQDGASPEEIGRVIDRAWALDREPDVRDLLPGV